ncbi:autophagy-related protein 2, partial [Phenoliferia sp. Uapishka_3]
MRVRCALVRVEVRCPAPMNAEERGKDWERATRSGIFVVDLYGVRTEKVEAREKEGVGELVVTCERTAAYFVPSKSTRAHPFVILSAFAVPTSPNAHPETSFPPTLTLLPRSIEIQIPLLHISLDKSTFDGLELFVDDLGQWSERRSKMSEGGEEQARIVGSRYFGKGGNSTRGESESGEGEEVRCEMGIRLAVSDVILELRLEPRGDLLVGREIRGLVSDVDVKVDLLSNSKSNMIIEAIIMDVKVEDATLPTAPATGSTPIVRLGITSAVEQETGLKESKIKVVLANFTYHLSSDLGWLEDVALFAKAPEGAFETVVPNELTRLRLRIVDGSIQVKPPSLGSLLVINLSEASISTNLMPDMPRTMAAIEVKGLRILAVDSAADLLERSQSAETGYAYWKSMGFVDIVDVQRSTVQVRQGNGLVLPDFEVLISDTKVVVAICADTVAAVAALAGDFTAALAAQSKSAPPVVPAPSRRLPTRKQSADLLSSVDPSAFGHAPEFQDMPEYLDDDVPTNVDYLADALKQTSTRPKGRRSESTQGTASDGLIISDIEGETIKMLDPAGLRILDGFLAEPREDPDNDSESHTPSIFRFRLTNCDVKIHIHEGYDWAATRKAIEAEAKAVRRRLEKIRQLLANGQTADASVEEASVLMFGSVQLGLPPGASELATPALLAAIDEELAEKTEVASTVGSWQSLPDQPSKSKPTLVGKARKRLTRSPAFAIEVNLRGVGANFDTYPSASQLASRIRVDVSTFEIIDNIRTSTWRKFLTELRASDGGVVRASGASMVRFELNKVRPVGRTASSQDEITMKIKIFPLRLYIDQDALDFLKAFGGFKVPSSADTPGLEGDTSTGPEPFFQRVEVLPVKIKLDYKPKRVDYHALRQGKTAELMNFFHFDGSEMTLRHLVVTGVSVLSSKNLSKLTDLYLQVSGSTRLSELVQDIWTPDVKANQLADVISGIAPVRSVVNLGSGVANLVLLPIEQYRKDGRLARGIQRGATSFARTTTLEALNVGARLATGTQVILEQAESVLGARFNTSVTAEALAAASEGSPVLLSEEEHADLISRYSAQPGDLREGIESAYRSLGGNFRSAAQTILAVPMEVYERSGSEVSLPCEFWSANLWQIKLNFVSQGPVRAVVRAVPIAVLKPMIGASEAVSKALFGLRNTLDPDAIAEAADKYKARSP